MEWLYVMKQIKYLMKLNLYYIKSNKKLYINFIIGIFLSTFILASIYIVKNSYDDYHLRTLAYPTGAWEVQYVYDGVHKEYDGLINYTYISSSDIYNYKDTSISPLYVSKFDDLLNIDLKEGRYPQNSNELILDELFASNNHILLNDHLTLVNDKHEEKVFKVVGFNANFNSKKVYSYLDNGNNITQVYAQFKNKDEFVIFEKDDYFLINEEFVNTKYFGNKAFDTIILLFVIFVFGCMSIQMYTSTYMYLKRKEEYMLHLYYAGATKKQRILMNFLEFIFVNSIFMFISFLISIVIWKLFITIQSTLIKEILGARIDFHYVFKIKYQIIVILMTLLICFVSFFVALISNFKKHHKNIKYRKIQLKQFPISSRLGVLDILRKRFGILICLSICISSILFMCSQIIVETWLHNYEVTLVEEDNICANFALFNIKKT